LGVQQQLGTYNRNLHHHINTCQHQTWQRHDISSCIFVKCVGSQALTGLQDTHTHTHLHWIRTYPGTTLFYHLL
jgi:hypothetical protein